MTCAIILGWTVAPLAIAHRAPTMPEFKAIARAVDRKSAHQYCARRDAVDVSTVDPRWAAAFGISNCGGGSGEARFYLRRPTRHSAHWRVVQVTYAHGVGGGGPPCGGARVPRDVRCGVPGRS